MAVMACSGGVVLNESFPFETQGQELNLSFSHIAKLSAGMLGRGALTVVAVDGSWYQGIIAKEPQIRLLTIAGIQAITLRQASGQPLYTKDTWFDRHMRTAGMDPSGFYDRFRFIPSKAKDVDRLRNDLGFALKNNKEQIEEVIGGEPFSQFFKM